MNAIDLDDWEELRPIIEDGEMGFTAGEPDTLRLKLARGFACEWSLTKLVDDVLDHIETVAQMDEAKYLGEFLERQGKRVRRALADMEAS